MVVTTEPMRSPEFICVENIMTARGFVRNQLYAALIGAAAVAAPVGALYALGAGPATAPAAATQPAPTVSAPATGNPNAVLPDFSTMVQKYGSAVVNISVVSKVPASYTQGDIALGVGRRYLGYNTDVDDGRAVLLHHGAEVRKHCVRVTGRGCADGGRWLCGGRRCRGGTGAKRVQRAHRR